MTRISDDLFDNTPQLLTKADSIRRKLDETPRTKPYQMTRIYLLRDLDATLRAVHNAKRRAAYRQRKPVNLAEQEAAQRVAELEFELEELTS